ncbi:hypothetical protein HDU84_005392 [Entophlyctis sp. JEL0112]|nr:hypothetical protein HDU84_005392 [Entophlyctis sp. JEL0112]
MQSSNSGSDSNSKAADDQSVAMFTALAKDYRLGPRQFVPGYDQIHPMIVQLLDESLAAASSPTVLVLGAGGAVDPSEPMLASAKDFVKEDVAAERITWVNGYIYDAPLEHYAAATCLMTLHMIPDNGEKLETLKQIRSRLHPDAPLVVLDNCLDPQAKDYQLKLNRYKQFAINFGVPPEIANKITDQVDKQNRERKICISPAREEELFSLSGFKNCELFYAGLSWRGWVMRA